MSAETSVINSATFRPIDYPDDYRRNEHRLIRRYIVSPTLYDYGVLLDDVVVAFGTLSIMSGLVSPRTAHIYNVEVADIWRGYGLGRVLIEGIEAAAENRGMLQIELTADNANAAEFYRHLGYGPTARMEIGAEYGPMAKQLFVNMVK
jgi:GNAT superfamily N-acetyltransferase